MADINLTEDGSYPFGLGGLRALIGRSIVRVYRDAGRTDIALLLDDDHVLCADPEGDCCSRSWVEHISGVGDLIDATVIAIHENPETESPESNRDHEDVTILYGLTLVTAARHRVDIEYRNNSNGYYGGWLNWTIHEDFDLGSWTLTTQDF